MPPKALPLIKIIIYCNNTCIYNTTIKSVSSLFWDKIIEPEIDVFNSSIIRKTSLPFKHQRFSILSIFSVLYKISNYILCFLGYLSLFIS